ncbi:hypothetical protein M6B38_269000 [Iris pallida]|uniref:Secreted protein n=1 Tax=Iris pallida TaxID=29817 RepID=A0AAX6I9F1_IRIPA|nr:hypothetical protein M6B38_269000 [Iris pallida]
MWLWGRPLLAISGWGNTGQRGHNQRQRNYDEEAGVPGEAEVHIGVAGLGGPDLWFVGLESLRCGGSLVWLCPRDATQGSRIWTQQSKSILEAALVAP